MTKNSEWIMNKCYINTKCVPSLAIMIDDFFKVKVKIRIQNRNNITFLSFKLYK